MVRQPVEFGSLFDSDTGSKASRYKACIALFRMVGIPEGVTFHWPTLRNGKGLYPRRFNLPTASHRLSGESHSSRSTPAVRAPWFCVTRRTAYSFADNVRVSIRCRAFTLLQSSSRVAFAIRICIPLSRSVPLDANNLRRTSCPARGKAQIHPFGRVLSAALLPWGDQPSSSRHICPSGADMSRWGTTLFLGIGTCVYTSNRYLQRGHKCPRCAKSKRSVSRLATVDQTQVCPLSREVMFQPLCEPLQPAIRFFRPPIPAQPTVFLTLHLPSQLLLAALYGLTASRHVTRLT